MNQSIEESTTLTLDGVRALLQVFDMPASLRFYRDVLGFEVIRYAPDGTTLDEFGWVSLQCGGAQVMLNTAYDPDDVRPPQPEARRVAAHGDTILFIGCPDVDAAYRYLQDRGVDVKPPETTHYGMKQLYFTDPDGFGLCFQWPAERAS